MNNKKKRCLKRSSDGKKCPYIAEMNGYCRHHQDEPLSLHFWQNKDEKERLHYLQLLAEIRAIEAYKDQKKGKEADMSFNRNLRMVAAIAKLRHDLKDFKKAATDSQDQWVKFLEEDQA